jgi:hypothetical protein
VTFIGDKHLCAHCVPKSSPTKAAPGSPTRSTLGQPNFASTPAKADESLDSSRKSTNDGVYKCVLKFVIEYINF